MPHPLRLFYQGGNTSLFIASMFLAQMPVQCYMCLQLDLFMILVSGYIPRRGTLIFTSSVLHNMCICIFKYVHDTKLVVCNLVRIKYHAVKSAVMLIVIEIPNQILKNKDQYIQAFN